MAKRSMERQVRSLSVKHQMHAFKYGVTLEYREAKFMALESLLFELPDDEYWAAFKQHGYTPDEVLKIAESLAERNISYET